MLKRLHSWGHYLILGLSILLIQCIEEFDVSIPGGNNLLVVEGVITDQPGPYTVKLSRSSLLSENEFPPESGATVIIEEENGPSERLNEENAGEYRTSFLQGEAGKRYRLLITLTDSKSYSTDWILLKASPPVERVYNEFQETLINLEPKVGYQFYVDSRDPQNQTTFYRYEWTESWIFAVPFPSTALYLGNDEVMPILPEDRNDRCWTFEEYTGINIANSENNAEDVISRHPLHFVTNDPERLKIRYGIQLRQYAVTEEEYSFWEGLLATSAESGSLFEVQPQVVRSNVFNNNNPDEPVFGYFSVSGVSTGASFVDFKDLPDIGVADLYTGFCRGQFLSIPKNAESEQLIQEILAEGWLFYELLYPTLGPQVVIGYRFISPFCGDCTFSRGGTTEMPGWWVP